MGPTEFLLATLFIVSGLLPVVLAGLFFEQRHKPGAKGLLILSGGICLWGLANAIHVFAYTEQFAFAVWNARLVGTGLTVVGWFLTVAEYTGMVTVRRRTVAGLLVVPAVGQVFAWSNPVHHLHYGQTTTFTAVESIVLNYGPSFYVTVVYLYTLVVGGVVLLLAEIVDAGRLRRRQSLALLVSAIPPAVGNLTYLAVVRTIDLTSFGFMCSIIIISWALFYGRLLDVVPVARDNLVRNMTDPVVTLDGKNRVVDCNPAARDLCGVEDDYVGMHGEAFFAPFPNLVERFGDVMGVSTEVTVEDGDDVRHFDLRITPVRDEWGEQSGQLIVLRDVTARKRREQELEQKNERLDQFATFLSHDLRNPLQVASGHASLARETGETAHIERVESSLARMEEMVADLRTLTQADEHHVETTRIDLESVAHDAWAGVDLDDASLLVESSCLVVADREFLLHALENLFRNAVDHGSAGVTVSVGCLDSNTGFYVADDGPGIPHEECEKILEYGYTTADEGTGIGLSIVRTVADAHGWDLAITESADCGARFEFEGATPWVDDATAHQRP